MKPLSRLMTATAILTLFAGYVPRTHAGFTNMNAGLPGVSGGSVAWGDYDNDGRLDILLTGDTGSNRIAQVWRNTGSGFTITNAGLPGVAYGSVAWGDYDNDGRLDVLLTGDTGSGFIAQVWRNTGGGFANINAGLPGVAFSSVAWGDYDNDGRMDILVTGDTGSGATAQVWQNTGGGFTNVSAGLPGVSGGSVAWGDYDNDGRLDTLLTGFSDSGPIAQVWRNSGDGTFSNINAGLPGIAYRSVAWGDYNNDGRLDILLTGDTGSQLWRNTGSHFISINAGLPDVSTGGSAAWGDYDNDGQLDILLVDFDMDVGYAVAQVWRNNGNGTFTDINAALPGVSDGSIAWGDYDNDGRLDILLTGFSDSGPIAQVWGNGGTTTNAPPQAPTGLSATSSPCGGRIVTLGWNRPTDDHTPTNGLSYNLRIGSSPAAEDRCSPMAATNGLRRIVRLGSNQTNSWTVQELPSGTYYWSVQAIDTAFRGGPFSTEGTFMSYDNSAPTDILLSNSSVAENQPAGTIVGTLTAADDPGDTNAFALVSGTGDTNNNSFTVQGNLLKTAASFDYESKNSYSFRVRATDTGGCFLEKPFTIAISNVLFSGVSGSQTNLQGSTFTMGWIDAPTNQISVVIATDNPVLVPTNAFRVIAINAGASELQLLPQANQAGSANLTVTVISGGTTNVQTCCLTMLPHAPPMLQIASIGQVPPQTLRFQFNDWGTAATNYAVEFRSDLSASNDWTATTNAIASVDNVTYQFQVVSPGNQGFYRVRAFPSLVANFSPVTNTISEGVGTMNLVLLFNGIFQGDLAYTISGPDSNSVAALNGTVHVNGTTAAIPVTVLDNATIDRLRYLTLTLQTNATFQLGSNRELNLTIEENDANWQGLLQTEVGTLGFVLTMLNSNATLSASLGSGGLGFFPSNPVPALVTSTANAFTCTVTNIQMPASSTVFNSSNNVTLNLWAANGTTNQTVSSTQVAGATELIITVPDKPYLNTTNWGTFVLLKPPTAPSTNEVTLTPVP